MGPLENLPEEIASSTYPKIKKIKEHIRELISAPTLVFFTLLPSLPSASLLAVYHLSQYRLIFRNWILIGLLTVFRLLSTTGILIIIRLLIFIWDRIVSRLLIVIRILIVFRDQLLVKLLRSNSNSTSNSNSNSNNNSRSNGNSTSNSNSTSNNNRRSNSNSTSYSNSTSNNNLTLKPRSWKQRSIYLRNEWPWWASIRSSVL